MRNVHIQDIVYEENVYIYILKEDFADIVYEEICQFSYDIDNFLHWISTK